MYKSYYDIYLKYLTGGGGGLLAGTSGEIVSSIWQKAVYFDKETVSVEVGLF